MNVYEKELESIGFSSNKARVYFAVVKHPGITAGTLIKDLKLQRSVVYINLEELEKDSLIVAQKEKGKVTMFYPGTSSNLILQQEKQLLAAERLARDFTRMNLSYSTEEVFVYHGPDAIRYVCDQHFIGAQPNEILFMGSSKYGNQAQLGGYWNQYHKKRTNASIPSRILYDQSTDQKVIMRRNKLDQCEARYMPYGKHISSWQCIWGEYVALFVPKEHVTYIIKNPSAADAAREHFNFLWKHGRK